MQYIRNTPCLTAVAILFSSILVSCVSTNQGEPAKTGPVVRVCLDEEQNHVLLTLRSGSLLETGGRSIRLRKQVQLACTPVAGVQLKIRDLSSDLLLSGTDLRCTAAIQSSVGYQGKEYPDTILVVPTGTGLTVINTLPVEKYLSSVIPNEMGRKRREKDLEALRAQSIIARNYVLNKISLPLTRQYDVYDDIRDQVYGGLQVRTQLSDEGVRSTRGQVLMYGDNLAECYFHSACGGKTEAISLVWQRPQSKPYLSGVIDAGPRGDYCAIAPSYRWEEVFDRSTLESMFTAYLESTHGRPGGRSEKLHLYDIRILNRGPSGRVTRLKIVLGNRSGQHGFILNGDRIRSVLRRPDGKRILRSTLIDIDIRRDDSRWIESVLIRGGGNGHGTGLCQWGAIARSRAGFTAAEILEEYFPKTFIKKIY